MSFLVDRWCKMTTLWPYSQRMCKKKKEVEFQISLFSLKSIFLMQNSRIQHECNSSKDWLNNRYAFNNCGISSKPLCLFKINQSCRFCNHATHPCQYHRGFQTADAYLKCLLAEVLFKNSKTDLLKEKAIDYYLKISPSDTSNDMSIQ